MAKYGRIPASRLVDKSAIIQAVMDGAEKLIDEKSFENIMVNAPYNYVEPTITNKLDEITKIADEEFVSVYTKQKIPKEAMASAKKRSDALLKQ